MMRAFAGGAEGRGRRIGGREGRMGKGVEGRDGI